MLEKAGRKEEGGDIGRSEPHCRITRAGSCPREHKTTDAGCWPRGKFMTRLYAEIETWSASFTRVQIEHADFPPEKFLKIFSSKGDLLFRHPVRLTFRRVESNF